MMRIFKFANIQINNPNFMNQGGLIYKELSYKINGILFAVHNEIDRYANEKQVCDYIEEKFKQNKINYIREEILNKSFP